MQRAMDSQKAAPPLSYEQFQQQQRMRQEQEQAMAKAALQSAGADRHSEQLRGLLVQLQELEAEIARAENQVQVQMDAQLRQLQAVRSRIRQTENAAQQLLTTPASYMQ